MLLALLLAAQTSFTTTIPAELLGDFPGNWPPDAPMQFVSAQPVDADGNPATAEWLLHYDGIPMPPCVDLNGNPCTQFKPAWLQWYRVVSVRNGVYCKGRWFKPQAEATDATITLYFDGRVHRFVINDIYSRITVVLLDLPFCP